MGEEWNRFKIGIEKPLAVYGTIFLKTIMIGGKLLTGGGSESRQIGEELGAMIFGPDGPTMPEKNVQGGAIKNPDVLRMAAEKSLGDKERARVEAEFRQDPAYRLQEERTRLRELEPGYKRGGPEEVQQYEDQFN
jgi:hypothetical protein